MNGGTGRGGRGDPPGPRNAGKERPPPPPPAAAPVRTGFEPPGPVTGEDGRGRRGLTLPVQTGMTEATIPDPCLFLRFLLYLGYRRLRPNNLLDHPVRRELVRVITEEPGLALADCVTITGINRETLRYHLALLVHGGRILEEMRNGSVRYFPRDPVLTPVRRAVIHLDRTKGLGTTLRIIGERPGIPRRELAVLLGISGPSVTRQLQRLEKMKLVENRGIGKKQGYWLSPACADAVSWIAIKDRCNERPVTPLPGVEEAFPVS